MTNTSALLAFQLYQQAFCAYCRQPEHENQGRDKVQAAHSQLIGIPENRLKVYEDIVYTNIFEAVCACFPVATRIVKSEDWHDVIRGFLSSHSATSPLFRVIPAEFLSYLKDAKTNNLNRLPAFLFSLCHYEWLELAASSYPKPISVTKTNEVDFKSPAILEQNLIFSSSVYLCLYDYAVHTISPENIPTKKSPTQILVYCDTSFKVQFLVLNPVTLLLLHLLRGRPKHWSHHFIDTLQVYPSVPSPLTVGDALLVVADTMLNTSIDEVMSFGLAFLTQLHQQGVILGTTSLEHNALFNQASIEPYT